jgi:glycine cleavage system H protein
MQFPNELKYSKEHTWLRIEGDSGAVGITEFAQSELGEIVYVDLPSIGKSFKQDEVFGSVEAIKTVSDLFMPAGGTITEINPALKDNPTLINTDPFNSGWLIKISLSDITQLDFLLNAEAYQQLIT